MPKTHKQPSKKAMVATRIFIAVLILATIVAVFFFVRSIVDKRILIDQGEQVTGIVNTREIDIHTSRSGNMTTRTLSYTFTPKGAQEKVTRDKFNVSQKEYEKYLQDSEIPISYLPDNPSMNAPSVSLRHMHPLSALFVYYLGIFGACLLFAKVGKLLRKKYKIKKEPGIPNYFLSVGVFVVAVATGMGVAILTSRLVSLLLS
ncbi:hypothetical protein D3C85_204500 [compost metagenome]|jgi:hypothetical protein